MKSSCCDASLLTHHKSFLAPEHFKNIISEVAIASRSDSTGHGTLSEPLRESLDNYSNIAEN